MGVKCILRSAGACPATFAPRDACGSRSCQRSDACVLSLGVSRSICLRKLKPLGVAVALLALGDDLTVEYVERSKQGRRSIAFVVMRHGGRTALLHGQAGLRAVQRLYLALLVAAQHQCLLRGRHVQAHDIFKLPGKLGVARDLEAAHQVGLEAMFALYPQHHGVAHAEHFGQRPGAPVCGRPRRTLGRQLHDFRLNDGVAGTPASRQVFFDIGHTTGTKALRPSVQPECARCPACQRW